MKLSQELFEKTYRNYIQQYPSHEEFFRRVIKQDGPINRIWFYTYLPAEELDLRTKFKEEIKERDYQELHQRMIREKGQELTDLHNDFIIVEKADRIHLNPDPLKMIYHEVPLTIAGIRKLLRRVEERTYREGEKNISERKEYQYLPWWIYITREISNGKTKVEVEIEFLRKPNFEEQVHYWESFSITEILQRFKDMSEIVGTVWNINPDVDYSIILSHGGKKRQFPVNLLHRERYYNLIRSALQKYRVERDKGGGKGGKIGLGEYEIFREEPLLGEAIMAVLNLSMEYRGKEHGFFPGYLKKRLDSYLLGIWRSSEITTTQLFKERKEREKGEDRSRESYRILKSDLEYSGGSLDEEITVDEGKGEVRRADLLPDESWSEDSLINGLTLEELIDSLSDPLDREIFDRYYSKDESQAEIGQNMGITQQAVAKRLKKIEGHLQEGFKRGK